MDTLATKGHLGFYGRVGVARRDITPDLRVRARCWGPARHDLAEGVHRPLTLTALVVEEGHSGSPLVLISSDLSFFRRGEDEWRIRGRVLRELELAEDRVVFHLIHTHAGPSLSTDELDRPGGDQVPAYLDHVAAQAVSATQEALSRLAPAVLEWTTARCSLASNRELVEEERSLVGWNPSITADDTLIVGRVSGQDGGVIATVVNYACHPTTLAWQNRLLSPDYVGATREVVEQASGGAPCLFLQGASGDLAPRYQYVGDVEVADTHGRELGYAVLSALSAMLPPRTRLRRAGTVESGAPLAMWEPVATSRATTLAAAAGWLELPMQRLASLEELSSRWSGIDPTSLEERLTRARSIRAPYGEATTLKYPVWVWRLGDSYFVGHPGEAYSHLQHKLRKLHPDTCIVVANLCNGPGFFYFPTCEAFTTGAYPSWQTLIDQGALESLIAEASQMITSLSELAHRGP
jgi:hypothetical protein